MKLRCGLVTNLQNNLVLTVNMIPAPRFNAT